MEKLRDAGLRITPQRRAVWSVFEGEPGEHLTADEVFGLARRELPELSRATVYNTLAILVDLGLLRTVESRSAVLYDSNPDPAHHHFRCRDCGRLYDVRVDGIEGLGISDGRKFAVDSKAVMLGGLCPACLEA